jgi:hypothetical protein
MGPAASQGKGAMNAFSHGPSDGTGNQGIGPQDGSGFGASAK